MQNAKGKRQNIKCVEMFVRRDAGDASIASIHILLLLLVLTAMIVSACAPRVSVETRSANQLHVTAEAAFRAKNYSEAMGFYQRYLQQYPQGPHVTAVLMRVAEIHQAKGSWEAARTTYRRLIDRFPESGLVPDAAVGILRAFYKDGRPKDLIRHADEMLKKVKQPEDIRHIYLLLGDAYMAIESPINAVYYYSISEQYARYPSVGTREKIDRAISELSGEDIEVLLGRIGDSDANPSIRGDLLHQLALIYIQEDRKGDAGRILSDFVETFPDHRKTEAVQKLMEEHETLPLASRHTIGCLLPLTGRYKIYGNRALRGVELAMSQSSGLHLVVRDTGSDNQTGLMAINDLLESAAPSAVIGPIITAETVAQEAQNARIPIITLTQKEGITDIGDFVFRNFITPRMQTAALVSYSVKRLGKYRFAVLYPNEKYGATFFQLFQEEAALVDGVVVSSAAYEINQTDFRRTIQELRAKSRRATEEQAAEAVFIPDAPRKTGLILPQLAYYNIRTQLLGTNLWHSDQLIRMAGRYAEGAVFPTGFFPESDAPHIVDFMAAFKDAYGEAPGFIEAIAYDTARILIQILSQPDIRYKSALREKLINLRDFPGVTGRTGFNENGEAVKDLYMLKIRRGKFVDANEGGVALLHAQ